MAKISSPWVGIGEGKMGEGVYYPRKGQTCARQYRGSISEPNTEKQQTVRSKFKTGLAFCQFLINFFKTFWTTALGTKSKFNSFMGYTVKNALQLVGGVWTLDWTKVRFAAGTLLGFETPGATNPTGQTIIFTWVDDSGIGSAKPDDTFAYLYINTTTYPTNPEGSFAFGNTTQKRSDQTYSFAAPAGWTGNDVAVYGCFLSADGTLSSNSYYFGTLTLH